MESRQLRVRFYRTTKENKTQREVDATPGVGCYKTGAVTRITQLAL